MINNKLWTLDTCKQNIQYSYDFVVFCCVGPLALPRKDKIDPWQYWVCSPYKCVRLPWLLKMISGLYKPTNNRIKTLQFLYYATLFCNLNIMLIACLKLCYIYYFFKTLIKYNGLQTLESLIFTCFIHSKD